MTERNSVAPFRTGDWLNSNSIQLTPVTSGMENTCTRLKTAQGELYLLKVFSSPDRYFPELESKLATLFVQTGLKTAHIHPAKDGRNVVERDGQFAILYSWIPGTAPSLSGETIGLMVSTMAVIHSIPPPAGLRPYHYSPTQLIADIRNEWDKISPIHSVLERCWSTLEAVASYNGPRCLCHTDIQARNFIISPDGLPFVIDHEHAALEAVEFDLARAIVFSVAGLPTLFPRQIMDVLSAYRTARPDFVIDVNLLREFLIYNFAMILFWRYRAYNLGQSSHHHAGLYKSLLGPSDSILAMDASRFYELSALQNTAG